MPQESCAIEFSLASKLATESKNESSVASKLATESKKKDAGAQVILESVPKSEHIAQ